MARLNLMETVNPAQNQNLIYDERPDWFKNWETTGLLGFDDKNGDGAIQYTADATTNELRVDRDIMVLANPEIANLPNWVIALVAQVVWQQHYLQPRAYYWQYPRPYPMT